MFHMPLNEVRKELLELSEEQIELFSNDKDDIPKITGNLPFNFSQLTYDSIILRQVEKEKTAFNSLTAEFFRGGSAKFFVPISYSMCSTKNHLDLLGNDEIGNTLQKLWGDNLESDLSYLKFMEVNQLFLSTLTALNYYQKWIGKGSFLPDVKVVAELTGVWRIVPFFPSVHWSEFVETFGLPTIGTDNLKIPSNFEWASPISLDEKKLPLLVLSSIAFALGFSEDLFGKSISNAIEKAAKFSGNNK